MDVDPVLQRGLGLLISRASDSAERLRKLMFETLGREYIPPKPSQKADKENSTKKRVKSESVDFADADTDVESNVDETMDADDFAFDMGISCTVCRQFDVSPTNQLLECRSCGTLYHQKCHEPAVSPEDVNSPDFSWNCDKCGKSIGSNLKISVTETDSRVSSPKPYKKDKSGEEKKVKSSSNKDKKLDKRDKLEKTGKSDKPLKSDKNEKSGRSEKSSKSSKEKDVEKYSKLDTSSKDGKSKSTKSDSSKTRTEKHKLVDDKIRKSEEKKSKKAKKEKS